MWGFLAIILKVALRELGTVEVTWFRFSLAFLFLFIYYLILQPKELGIIIKPPKLALLAAVFLGCNYYGFINGVNHSTPVISQIFIQAGPVTLALSGFILFKEKLRWTQLLGFAIVVIGYFIFYHERIVVLSGNLSTYQKGVYWTLFGAITWALYAIFQKKAVVKYHPVHINLVIFLVPTIAYAFFVDYNAVAHISMVEWFLLILLGINTLLAYSFISLALKHLEANKLSVIITCNPVITFVAMAILGWLEVKWIEAEQWSLVSLLGAVLVLIGVIITVIKKRS